ncbi:MAG: hypothetical protein ACI9N1_003003, partial [Flavobacteriales bacterium]
PKTPKPQNPNKRIHEAHFKRLRENPVRHIFKA